MDEEVRSAEQPLSARETLAAVAASGLLDPGQPVLVLCSGGRDSVCLLHAAAQLADTGRVSALHVNYGLRREDSDADEALVRELCAGLGLKLDVVHAPAAPRSGNLQAWARDLRYGAASRLASARGGLVATAHTSTDQVEGILYRLVASPGRRALLGMESRDGILVRPLLGVNRAATGAYCRERGLRWRDDRSNADLSFTRARVRMRVVPELRSIHAAAEQNVLATAELLRTEAEVLDAAVSEVLDGSREIEAARLAALPAALARLVVARLAEAAAGRLVPGAGRRTPELLRLAASAQGRAALDLSAEVRAELEYGMLSMTRRAEIVPSPVARALAVPGSASFGAWRLTCELRTGEPRELLELGVPDQPENGRAVGLLDAATLADSLTVRAWRHGDRMSPLGMGGSTRSLADLFGSRRVPRAQRSALPIVLSGMEIVWIPGVATSEHFKLGPHTHTAAVLDAHLVSSSRPPAQDKRS